MKGKIFLVPFGKQGTTEFLFQKAIDGISGNDFSNILYIGPTPRKIRDAQIAFTRLVKSKAFITPQFSTIKQFATELFQEHNRNKRKLPDYVKPLLIQKLNTNTTIGYAQKIGEFIREVKQYLPDLTPEKLKQRILKELESKGPISTEELQKQVLEAIEMLLLYNHTLNKNNWLDSEDILSETLKLITEKCKIKTLILDGFFYDLTKLEEKIVAALIENAQKIYALSFYDKQNPEAYSLPQEFLTFLRELNVFDEIYSEDQSNIRTNLPHYQCPSIEEEVEAIASLIKHNFLKEKLSLNRSLVTFSRLNEYEPIIHRVFAKYGILHTIYSAKPLSQTQAVISVLELLRSIINNYPRLSTVAVLSSPYFERFSTLTKEWVGYYSKKGLIIKNVSDWRSFDTKIISILESDGETSLREKQAIEQIQKEIIDFIVATDKFKQTKNTFTGYSQKLKDLLKELKWCANRTEKDETIKTIKNEFYNLLNSLENFENDFGVIDLSENDFLRIIEYLLDLHQIQPEVLIKGVAVLEFSETRGLDCDHLFFGGLTEDKFPGQLRYDPILPEWLKAKLGLFSLEQHLARAKFHYFRLVNTARIDTFLSCYNTEGDRLFLPSPFLTDENRTPPSFNTIFSEEQKQRDIGSKDKIDLLSLLTPVNFSKDTEIQKLLRAKFGPGRRLSVTKLEQYPRCPHRFYLEKVLDLAPLEEPRFEVEAKIWGNVAHRVFERLYKTEVVPLEKLAEKLEAILNAVLQDEKLPAFWAEVTKRIFLNNLLYFIQVENDLRVQGFMPSQVEQYFVGNITKDIKISGIIDRIDINKSDKKVKILDYKTGKTPSITGLQVEKGNHLQLPLYVYLVKSSRPEWNIVNAGIYSLVDNKITWLVNKKINLSQLVDFAIKSAQRFAYNIRQGVFNLPPDNLGNCQYCDYRSICPMLLKNKPGEVAQNSFSETPLFAE